MPPISPWLRHRGWLVVLGAFLIQVVGFGAIYSSSAFSAEIAASLGPKAKIVKINIDENPNTPSRYGVRGIPTLMVFKGGQVAATKVGAAPKNQLQAWIEQSI